MSNINDYDFYLPPELIAQAPLPQRDASRLLVLERAGGKIEHRHFRDLVYYLRAGDCLVLNDTKVLPARLFGQKLGGSSEIEVVLLRQLNLTDWEVLVRPGRRARVGTSIIFGNGELKATVLANTDAGGRVLRFQFEGQFLEILDKLGQMPLPPYIVEKLADKNRYQTVYARELGSAAAPTAGLHFTPELLSELAERGIKIARLTLHVGLGTFRPVQVERIEEHKMHAEYYSITTETAALINQARLSGGRVIAVGTTSARTLETVGQPDGRVQAGSGWTDIFIYPGYQFKVVDGLITNFHLPKSTLIMLVSALAGREQVLAAYQEAIREGYRFYSFGDAMFII
ncbi:MAG: tRNA preQ1(34) S-adenosylmethionine ribosyltransferase-isomerase QueA [Firmicutes bacterium]|nr:tRNA preQ1(34) S-adenosylmethionine ribosyltransferase-isomerase QueA [Bacillota bacterium]